ncbi:unnamed protein product [Phytophthora fragariaefolia]|uniref:Unnamed protein product n=1 Tax=Phytophthora fragariaefolia TaxID=1490495 RepID=A0A9W7DB65_9STRA|nr:unnamed protein product [Phytophthora fragariaefolia]
MNNGVVAALQRGVSDLIIVGDSRLAIQQSMGVIACKKDALQVDLARHKELTKKLNSVRYLHVVRLYNSAAGSMATEALEAKAGRVVLRLERKAELKALNKIPEMLYTCENSADTRRNSATIGKQSAENSAERTEEPKVTATTRSQARRLRFEDEGASDERPVRAFQNPSKTPTRRESIRNEAEFGGAQSQVSNDTAELLTELSEARTPDASDIDPLVVQAERRQRISNAQDEELRWADLKAYLKGEFTQLSHRRVHNAGKVANEFVLSENGLLYRQNKVRRPEELGELGLTLRLVVPTTMIDEVLQNCHNSIEGGHQGIVRTYHRVKADYYWIGLYAGVVKHVQSCEDCNTSKSKPHLKGYSPGNVMSDRPFHVVSMDFVIPLPRTRRGNTALLLFQDHFTGFVIAKEMSAAGALEVAKAFEECVFRRFGAPSLIRHDRDPRFMSEVFQKFSEMMQSGSRATLSYIPQANGQQERSVKTMIQTVRTYVEDHLQADWDDIAEKIVHAINNSRDSTRPETPFYLVHGWDARSALKATTESIRQGPTNSAETSDAAEWRREANRQREVALYLAR